MNPSNIVHTSHFHLIIHAINSFAHQEIVIFRYTLSLEKNRLLLAIYWLQQRTAKQWLITASVFASMVLLGIVGLAILFLNPRTHTYSFAGDNCFLNPIFLPNNIQNSGTETYKSSSRPKISIGNTPLLSTTTCLELAKIPNHQSPDRLTLKTPIAIQKDINLLPEQLPQIEPFESLKDPVSTDAVLLFKLDKPDKTFKYSIRVGEITSTCVLNDKLLGCPTIDLLLAQGQTFSYTINRNINNESALVTSGNITTLDPVAVLSGSIAQNENVYTKPNTIILNTNKTLKSASKISLNSVENQTEIPFTTTINDKTLVINLSSELSRNTNFVLTIEDLVAQDGAFLNETYVLNFKTSAGPQLQSINIASYKVSPSSSIALTFDVELDQNQDIENSVSLRGNAGVVSSNISIQNNTVIINPTNHLDSCANYTISINDSLLSKFGVSGGSAWGMQTRTICQQTFLVGSSVQGRSIVGYKFGNGDSKIVFVGGLHGNEKSSVLTLNSWIDDLERNYQNIPSNKTVIVIPNTNPDGYVASSRLNANKIDLNRNFPSSNWQSSVYLPGGLYLENGGGSSALSEPESTAVANYLINTSPRLVLTYHATAGAVIYNGAGDSSALSAIYSDKSGYSNYSYTQENSIFSYPTTGELEDWLRDKCNIPTLLVELATQYSNNFSRQKSAMWAMLTQ
jgi:hypothetical protein